MTIGKSKYPQWKNFKVKIEIVLKMNVIIKKSILS